MQTILTVEHLGLHAKIILGVMLLMQITVSVEV